MINIPFNLKIDKKIPCSTNLILILQNTKSKLLIESFSIKPIASHIICLTMSTFSILHIDWYYVGSV